jgi:hypothetical protein
LWIDGYNVLTSIEAALSGGVILRARDGCYRDMASMHGSYRKVEETISAIHILGELIPVCHRPSSHARSCRSLASGFRHVFLFEYRLRITPRRCRPLAISRAFGAATRTLAERRKQRSAVSGCQNEEGE